jgi:hypothetical protein
VGFDVKIRAPSGENCLLERKICPSLARSPESGGMHAFIATDAYKS